MDRKAASNDASEPVPKKSIPFHLFPDLEVLEKNLCFEKSFRTIIFNMFQNQCDPLSFALDIMYFSRDFSKGKSWSLSRAVMESLKEWCKYNNVLHLLTINLKAQALDRVLQQSNGRLVELVCEIFRLKDDCDYFNLIIKHMLSEKMYKQAYYMISALGVEQDFTLEEFAFPVFFLDNDTWVKVYLSKNSELQLKFVRILDSVCLSGSEIQNFIRSFPVEPVVKRHAYDPNRLQKRLANYIEYFGIDLKECPNLFYVRSENAMNYLFRKRYSEESIAPEAWEELIKGVVGDNLTLQKELLIKLVCVNDKIVALRLAEAFSLNKNDWPDILKTMTLPALDELYSQELEDLSLLNESSLYLSLRLNVSDIYVIDTPEKFVEAISDISENYDVVGIDAEWKPNLGISKEKLSLFQLAVWDAVYLLDILALKETLKQQVWESMIIRIFCNEQIIKLGYGIKNDLQMLVNIFSGEKTHQKFPRLIDMGTFFKELTREYPQVLTEIEKQNLQSSTEEDSKGLSQLCKTILGKSLNKGEQFSDWERRPLRENQMIYAALDAYCLLMIYEKLFHVLQDLGLDFDHLLDSTMNAKPKSEQKVKKKSKKLLQKAHEPKPVSQFKVVVDSMAHGVGKYLRLFGADVVILTNEDDHMQAVEISQTQNRIILSSGRPYEKLKGYVPEDMCFCVPLDFNCREQATTILKHFNITCKESDIFSRCSICNGSQYHTVSRDELFSLWKSQGYCEYQMEKVPPQKSQTSCYKSDFITEDGLMCNGVPVQLSVLSPRVFERVEQFFICTQCGKVYWEGSHFLRLKKHMSSIVGKDENSAESKSIYKILENSRPDDDFAALSIENDNSIQTNVENKTSALDASNDASSERSYSKHVMQFGIDSSDDDIDDIVFA